MPTSRGARRSATFDAPLVTIILLLFVTRTTSRAPAHQFLFAPAPVSPELEPRVGFASPPSAPAYDSSNTAPFFNAVPTRVCLRLKGRRGRVSGSEMMWAVRGEGWVCVRQAREKEPAVVGRRAMRSYGEKSDAFPVV